MSENDNNEIEYNDQNFQDQLEENKEIQEHPETSEESDSDDVKIPDENDDKENEYKTTDKDQEKTDPYPHKHIPGTVSALFTYFNNTKLPKVLAVSNDCDKLKNFADSLKDQVHREHEQIIDLLEKYNENLDYNSVDLFKLFANTYDIKVGITIENAKEITDKLMEDGNRVAIENVKSNKGNTCAIYYSKDIKSFDEVCEENKEVIPEFFIDNILIL